MGGVLKHPRIVKVKEGEWAGYYEVPKEDLLRILVAEAFLPEKAKKIVATGHRPDCLTFWVSE